MTIRDELRQLGMADGALCGYVTGAMAPLGEMLADGDAQGRRRIICDKVPDPRRAYEVIADGDGRVRLLAPVDEDPAALVRRLCEAGAP